MSGSSIELVASSGLERSEDPKEADDACLESDGVFDERLVMPTLRRQNRWLGCSAILIISSIVVFLVGRVYMTPDEGGLESVLLPVDDEQGSTVDNKAAHDRPARTHAGVISALLGNSTGSASGRDNSVFKNWLKHHGHVPPDFHNDHSPTPHDPGQENAPQQKQSTGTSNDTNNVESRLFDEQKWLQSKVALEDGVMFETVRQLKHDSGAFLEGLTFADGFLFESTGLYGQSSIRKLDTQTGEVIEKYDLEDKTLFAEGLAVANKRLYQLTYKRKLGYIYDINNISEPIGTFSFNSTTGEGWGLTFSPDSNELIMSDGSDFLHMIDPETLLPTRKVKIMRDGGRSANDINELEYFQGRVLANVWYQDIILVINPSTGVVEKEYDFSTLWLQSERYSQGAEVLNGISVSSHPAHIYVTGKNWDRMYLVELKF